MRRMILTLTSALALCAGALCASPAGDARQAIQAAYAAMDAATAHKNVSGVTTYLAPGYTSTDTKGIVSDAAQEREAATQLFAQAQSASAKTILVSLTLGTPTQATVLERSHIIMVLPPPTQSTKPVRAILSSTSRDTWVKTTQGWREKHDQALTEAFTVNGKPLPSP